MLKHGQLFVRPLQSAHGGHILFARPSLQRVEDCERFPAGLLPLAARRLEHAAVLRFNSVTQSFVLLLRRIALGFVAAASLGGYALVVGVRRGTASCEPPLNFRGC